MATDKTISKHRSVLVQRMISEITDKIRSGSLRPGDPLPGAHALAMEYGIGYSTVIHAYKTLSDAGLITTIRGSGAFVKSSARTSLTDILVCIPRQTYNPHSEWTTHDLLAGMSTAALAEGIRMQVLFADAIGDKWRYTIDSLGENVGLIFCWEAAPAWVLRLQRMAIPYALIMPSIMGDWESELPTVFPDYYGGVKLAVEHLLEHGFTHLAFLGNPHDSHEGPRYDGYHDALESRGIHEIDIIPCPDISRHAGQVAMAQYLTTHKKPKFDLLVSANDLRALGAMDVLSARGINVPGDLAVLGFDNIPAAAEAGLSTVQLNMHELGESGIHWFLNNVAGKQDSDIPKLKMDCPPIWRKSTEN
ncbi:MAG: GntR family transcriptional regulator [Armatimonadota bacterium]|nr:GntR family transcriptional regulator [bacterium]